MRRPWRIRWWCTAAVASSAGIGMRSADTARSDRIRMLCPASTRVGRLGADAVERRLEACRALGRGPGDVDRVGAERAVDQLVDRADLLEIGVGQDRLRDFEPLVRAGLAAEQVRPRADHRDQRHHQLLADRIDRRVGDLREVLLEVVVEQLRLAARARRSACRCPSSRPDRRPRSPSARGRTGRPPACSRRPAGDRAGSSDRCDGAGAGASGDRRQLLELVLRLLQPLLVGLGLGERALDLLVLDDAALLEVDQQHLAGLQPPLADDLLLRDRQHAGLRGHDHMIVVGDDEARRAAGRCGRAWRRSGGRR